MPRIVKRTAHAPAVITIGGETVKICRCGLSDDPGGRCVGFHNKTLDEDETKLYQYDEQLNRVEVKVEEVKQQTSV